MPSNTYRKDHIKLFTGISETSKAWFIIHFLSVLIHFRIRTKHKIELHGNKKRTSCYMFRIRLLPRRKSRKTLHVKIRAKHKIKLYSNKKRISCYIFSIRLLQEGRRSYKTTKLQKKSIHDVCLCYSIKGITELRHQP